MNSKVFSFLMLIIPGSLCADAGNKHISIEVNGAELMNGNGLMFVESMRKAESFLKTLGWSRQDIAELFIPLNSPEAKLYRLRFMKTHPHLTIGTNLMKTDGTIRGKTPEEAVDLLADKTTWPEKDILQFVVIPLNDPEAQRHRVKFMEDHPKLRRSWNTPQRSNG